LLAKPRNSRTNNPGGLEAVSGGDVGPRFFMAVYKVARFSVFAQWSLLTRPHAGATLILTFTDCP